MREERDSFEKQRNELLNDMKETKFKAELFDELLNSFSDNLLIYGALAKSLVDRYEINKDLESEE
ncbi:Uncharacterised protein [Staphylococcus simiae]|nr:Uncharacterised protein [Staphylococcus simiae]